MTVSPAALMDAAQQAARLAGAVALEHYRTALRVECKADGSPVTAADRAAERAAREFLDARFPADGLVGEELPPVRPAAARRWLIDPIDGTRAFVRTVPIWGSLIAAVEGDEVLAGAAAFPAVDELICAARGEGCWWNGVRARVSDVSRLTDCTVLFSDACIRDAQQREGVAALVSRVQSARTWGDCYGYLLVATGRAEAVLDPVMNDWDAAAVMPIIEEAGGVFTDWRGRRTAFGGSVVATNPAIADAVRRTLREPS
jgi:histidinol-phosphatase